MRILMLSQFYQPLIGGTEQHVRTLALELVACGHEVAVATMWHDGLETFESDQGIRIYRIRSSLHRLPFVFGDERRHAPPFPDPELMLALRHIILKEKPQIVHAHNWFVRSFLPLKSWSNARLVMTLHDYSLSCATQDLMYQQAVCSGPEAQKCLSCVRQHYGVSKGIPTLLTNWTMSSIERKEVDLFLTVSMAVAAGNGLITHKVPFQVVPNFIDEFVSANECRHPYLAQLPVDGYLLYVGALSHIKGVHILLQAYAQLIDPPPLVIIGYPTPDWAQYANRDYPNVFFFQNWPHDAVMDAWKGCSIALIPSVWSEPFGIVALEAMSMGKAIIAAKSGGLSDIVEDEETGLLVAPNDPLALQKAIQRLLANPALLRSMGSRSKQRVTRFQTKAVVSRIEQLYLKLLG